jgi:hypothetical protein
VLITGFGSMILQITVLLSYQSYTGILYHMFVVLTALFMAGASTGAAARTMGGLRTGGALRMLHGGFVVLALLVPLWLEVAGSGAIPHVLGAAGFLFISFAGGYLTGSYYRIIVDRAYPGCSGAPPAVFYSWDLIGAGLGGLLGGAVVLPLAGIYGSVVIVVVVHLASAMLLAPEAGGRRG